MDDRAGTIYALVQVCPDTCRPIPCFERPMTRMHQAYALCSKPCMEIFLSTDTAGWEASERSFEVDIQTPAFGFWGNNFEQHTFCTKLEPYAEAN